MKRQKTGHDGGKSYHDVIPSLDEYSMIYSSDAFRTAPPENFAQQSDSAWTQTLSWAVADDTNFALDPEDGDLYDEVVEGDVMDNTSSTATPAPAAVPVVKQKSKRAVGIMCYFYFLFINLHYTTAPSTCGVEGAVPTIVP